MRVVWLRKHGGPEVLVPGEAPEPELAPGRAVIDVALANVTFVETQTRAGTGPRPVTLPMIPGNGVGGVVAQVGADVDARLLGQPVVSSTGGSGGYAERVAVDAAGVFEVPAGLALDAAVALLADGRTAMMLVDAAEVREGERVLVEAAAGGVGTLLVQLAKNAGAVVVATAGGEQKLDLARDLGADWMIDYRDDGLGGESCAPRSGRSTSSSTGSVALRAAPRSGCCDAAGACSASGWRAASGRRFRICRGRRARRGARRPRAGAGGVARLHRAGTGRGCRGPDPCRHRSALPTRACCRRPCRHGVT